MEWRGAQLNGCQYTHGMAHRVEYTGVLLKVLLEQAGLKPSANWIMAEGADAAAMNRSIPLSKALDDCIVAYRMNGEMLRPEQGYPVRLVVPGWEGNVWVLNGCAASRSAISHGSHARRRRNTRISSKAAGRANSLL